MNIDTFNIRVYGVLENEGKILMIKESYQGEVLIKFPGGGLEFGESVRECLKREFEEELNLNIEVGEHLYTQDFFLTSKFKRNEQMLIIYYKVKCSNLSTFKWNDPDIEQVYWINKKELLSYLVLPTDIEVGKIMELEK